MVNRFNQRIDTILEQGHWAVRKGSNMSFVIDPDSRGSCSEMDPSTGFPKRKKKRKKHQRNLGL